MLCRRVALQTARVRILLKMCMESCRKVGHTPCLWKQFACAVTMTSDEVNIYIPLHTYASIKLHLQALWISAYMHHMRTRSIRAIPTSVAGCPRQPPLNHFGLMRTRSPSQVMCMSTRKHVMSGLADACRWYQHTHVNPLYSRWNDST